ncbi:MAG: ABC transporter permease [Phycisphaerales bacterium]|nr:MAG: ABC transporter permease [Phycisphaerales bacterium]
MHSIIQDIRFAFRMLAKTPGFTVIAVVTLALGIGVNTGMFTTINAMQRMTLRVTDVDEVVFIRTTTEREDDWPLSVKAYMNWRGQTGSFVDMGLSGLNTFILSGDVEPERITSATATPNLLPMLGFETQIGRLPQIGEDVPGAGRVVVLTDQLWQRKYSRSEGVLGNTLILNDLPHTIIGVLTREFELDYFWFSADVLTPILIDPAGVEDDDRHFRAIARLNPDVTIEQAQTELAVLAAQMSAANPDPEDDFGVVLRPVSEHIFSRKDQLASYALLAAVGLVLLIACANLANLLLARATSRAKEFAVRVALGAGRLRIIRQLLIESLLLALLGGALGLLFGVWAIDLFMARVEGVPMLPDELGLHPEVLAYTFIMSCAAALFFGLAPAVLASRVSLNETLKEGAMTASTGRSKNRLRNGLVAAQLAIALPLLICCGLVIRHVEAVKNIDFGFNTDHLISAEVDVPTYRYRDDKQRANFYEEMLRNIEALPGVESAGAALSLPVLGGGTAYARVKVEGYDVEEATEQDVRGYQVVTSDFFRTLEVPLISGRFFSDQDRSDTQPVAIVNQRMARRYWRDEDPIGRRVTLDSETSPVEWITIVGVVADSGRAFYGGPPAPTLYLPHQQRPLPSMVVAARTAGDPVDAIPALRNAIRSLDPSVPVHDFETVDDIVHRWLRDDRMSLMFFTTLAVLALALASLGLYGVMSYAVVQRTHEIGVRMALGAERNDIMRMVIGRSLRLAVIGILIGVALAMPVGLGIQSFLYGVGGTDPVTFLGVGVVLLAVALAAGYVPARRATKVDPMVALRYE